MKKLLLTLLSISGMYAQNEPNLIFANKEQNLNAGGAINVTLSAKDVFGNTYLVGTFSNVADFDPSAAEVNLTAIGSSDAFVAVYDSNGNNIGAQNIGGTGVVIPTAVAIAGGFIHIAGTYTNTIDFNPAAGVSNLTSTNISGSGFLAKYDLNGNFVTCKSIDGIGAVNILDVKVSNNEVIITGSLSSSMDFDPSASTLSLTSNGGTDAFLAKYDPNLLLLGAISFGGTGSDLSSTVSVESNGNIIISGPFIVTVDFDPSPNTTSLSSTVSTIQDIYIAKYSNNLAFQWVKDIDARQPLNNNPKLVLDSNSNIIITGTFAFSSDFDPGAGVVQVPSSGAQIFLAKYDVNGNYVWVKIIGNTSNHISRNIAIDSTNNIFIIGTFSGTVDFDPNAGVTNLISSTGTNFFAKYDNNGSLVFASNISTTITTVLVDNSNALLVAGTFSGLRDFDPSAATANLNSISTSGFIAKYTSGGAYTFAKLIGGDKPINQVLSFIGTDGLNNIYRVGALSAITDLDPTPAVFNVSSVSAPGIFIAKYTPNGNSLTWGRSLSASVGGNLFLNIMNTDVSGNTYITGRFLGTVDFDPSSNTASLTSASTTVFDFYMAKYDSNGNYLWAKQLGAFSAGAKRMLFDSFGNFYFVARVGGTTALDFDPSAAVASYTPQGTIDIVLAKYSPAGDYIWAKGIGGTGSALNETHFDLKGTSLYIAGLITGSVRFNPPTNDVVTSVGGSSNGFIAKYDLNGDYQFAYPVACSATGTNSSLTLNVIADEIGNFYLFTSLSGIADFDLLPSSTSFITSPTIGSTVSTAYVISKYSPTASLMWAKSLNQNALGNSIGQFNGHGYIHNNTLIYAYPFFNNGIDLDPSANEFIVTSNPGKTNLVLSKYDANNGNFIFGNKIDGNYDLTFNSSNFDTNKNLLLSGGFVGTADFNLSAAVNNLTSASPNIPDRFYVKYDSNIVLGLEDNIMGKSFVIYPNPATSILNIKLSDSAEVSKIVITDLLGKKILEQDGNKTAINIENLASGMYVLEVVSGGSKLTNKFIKQ